jgi:hypothetical protein
MNNIPPVCPSCQSPGQARSPDSAPDGKQAWICKQGHHFLWPYTAPPSAAKAVTLPCKFEFVLAGAGFECSVDGMAEFELKLTNDARTPVGAGSVRKHPNGRWYVASHPPTITEPMKHQIESNLNGDGNLE